MTIEKVSGVTLDAAVAKIECVSPENYSPSTDWAHGGPILAREIDVTEKRNGYYYVWRSKRPIKTNLGTPGLGCEMWATGETLLIAAMRCYVAAVQKGAQ